MLGIRCVGDRKGDSQHKGAAETNQQNRSVKRREQDSEETSQQKSERWLLGTVELQMPG